MLVFLFLIVFLVITLVTVKKRDHEAESRKRELFFPRMKENLFKLLAFTLGFLKQFAYSFVIEEKIKEDTFLGFLYM